MTNKELILEDYKRIKESGKISYIVTAIQLPSGEKELITNAHDLDTKFSYLMQTYDKDLKMYTNPMIKIVGWFII